MQQQSDDGRYDLTQRLLAYGEYKAAGRNFALVSSSELFHALQLSERQLVQLLTRLLAQGRIHRLKRTLYLLPGRLPPGKVWKPSALEVLSTHMESLGAKWQITGLTALSRHGISTQVAQDISVYNNKLSGKKVVAGNDFTFLKVADQCLEFTLEDKLAGGVLNVFYSSRARAVFDVISDQRHFSFLPEAYTWLAEIVREKATLNEFIECCYVLGNLQTTARVGFVLEKLGIMVPRLHEKFAAASVGSLSTLVPGSRRGPIHMRWNLIENVSLEEVLRNIEVPDEDDF